MATTRKRTAAPPSRERTRTTAKKPTTPTGERTTRRGRAPTTPEGVENELILLATDLTRRQLQDGTASAQQITHLLKAGSRRERLEQEKLQEDNRLLRARVEELESRTRVEDLAEKALEAMRRYTGHEGDPDYDH